MENPWPVSFTGSLSNKWNRSSYFAFRGSKLRNAVDLHHLPQRHALISNESRHAGPVGIPSWWAGRESHPQGCQILSRTHAVEKEVIASQIPSICEA